MKYEGALKDISICSTIYDSFNIYRLSGIARGRTGLNDDWKMGFTVYYGGLTESTRSR